MLHEIQSLKPQDVDSASAALAAAFMDDPLQVYTLPGKDEREEKSPAHFKAFLEFGLKFGEVYATADAMAAVVWLRPGETDITPEKAEEGGLTELPDLLGKEAAGRFFSVLEFIDPFHKLDVPEPHWYVMVVGVHPRYRGKGAGKALLEPVIKKAAADDIPVYLETAQPANVPFYQKLGFKIVRELKEPVSGLPIWTFKKEFTSHA